MSKEEEYQKRCVLFVTVEYFQSTIFSGNGVLGRSYVHGLARAGVNVLVVSAWPCENPTSTAVVVESQDCGSRGGGSILAAKIPVSASLWKRLDRFSCWSEFADRAVAWANCSSEVLANDGQEESYWATFIGLQQQQPKSPLRPKPQLGIAVDWTGYYALNALVEASSNTLPGSRDFDAVSDSAFSRVFLNFRVFANRTLLANQQLTLEDFEFYNHHELSAMTHPDTLVSVALCPTDVKMLEENQEVALKQYKQQSVSEGGDNPEEEEKAQKRTREGIRKLKFLLPPLRADSLAIAKEKSTEHNKKNKKHKQYITCCVRLIPDKNALFFAEVMACLTQRGTMHKYDLVPFLCGASADAEYASEVKTLLHAECPDVIIAQTFLSPQEMADIYSEAALNFHPCLYDAYGMTIVEAASVGCPSLLNGRTSSKAFDPTAVEVMSFECQVGASELLSPNPKEPEVLLADMAQGVTAIAQQIEFLLGEKSHDKEEDAGKMLLEVVGQRAKAKAMTWTEDQATQQLMKYMGW